MRKYSPDKVLLDIIKVNKPSNYGETQRPLFSGDKYNNKNIVLVSTEMSCEKAEFDYLVC